MARKRVKQYLMLLLAIGVVAIAAGGGGTFASFNAEVANTGNTFATGTLVLNDNGGTKTCTSAINNSNSNTAGTDCDTLFSLKKFTSAATTLTGSPITGAQTSITVGTITNGPIYPGDTLQIDNGTNQETLTVGGSSPYTAGPITVSGTLTNTYNSGAIVTDLNPTTFADLTLSNAGTLDAGGISYKGSGCTSAYGGPTAGTLNMATVTVGASSTTTLTVSGLSPATSFGSGDTVVVSESGHSQAFLATGTSSATSIPVTAQNWNFAYDTSATVRGIQFNGGTAQDLCNSLKLSAIEMPSASFPTTMTGALGCAIGSGTTPVATNACNLGNGVNMKTGLPSQYTALTLNSGGGSNNTGGDLDHNGSRYFLLAVHYTGSAFDNSYQNTTGTGFGLTWRIDQK
jgi:predicted ribosomally synthesized peptide with SipW-like signal peptide